MQSLMTLLLDSYVYLMTPLLNLVFKNMQNMNLLLVLFLCIFFCLYFIFKTALSLFNFLFYTDSVVKSPHKHSSPIVCRVGSCHF